MIKSLHIINNNNKVKLPFTGDNSIVLDYSSFLLKNINSFYIEIEFYSEIIAFRNHDYSWINLDNNRIANNFSTKAIKLNDGNYVQANNNEGIWEVKKADLNKLIWHFNPKFSNSLTSYGEKNTKKITQANFIYNEKKIPTLLFSKKGIIEVSRSKVPYSAIICFTDHCDFDTLDLLEKQRIFFKKYDIKITKGFFLNHFSKRNDNSSWQNENLELTKWIEDNHELAYHSLSQSIKGKYESLLDFDSFIPPLNISTWIDHGYQPYNLSLYKKENLNENYYSEKLKHKKVEILWNYLDSGTATSQVINQLNNKQFTLNYFWKGIKNKPLKKKLSLFIKNTIVHFYNDEFLIKNYSDLASSFKKFSKTKSIKDAVKFIKKSSQVLYPLLKILILWKINKDKVYPLAYYTPIFFEHTISNNKFIVFQTLELLDFKNALSLNSIKSLIEESGIFIGHTYFAVPMEYHDGKIFDKNGEINTIVNQNFNYISQKIKDKTIWNPTLIELVNYWKLYTSIEFKINENQEITLKNNTQLTYRLII